MERKLIKQGGGGFTIYLPKKWVSENKLDKGDELSITQSGKDLILSAKPSSKKSETEIHLKNSIEPTIRALVTNAYRIGYDKIKFIFTSEQQFETLQKIVKTRLIGFDIIKKENDSCIVENITEPSSDQFENILKKMFMNIEELFEITKKKLSDSKEELEDFEEVEERIHKYDNFCKRVITKEKLIKKNSEMFWTFTTMIIHAQREIYFLNKFLDKKTKVSKETFELFETAFDFFKILEKSYFEKNLEGLAELPKREREIIYKKTYSILQKNSKENPIVYHLASCIRQLNLSTSSLTGLII